MPIVMINALVILFGHLQRAGPGVQPDEVRADPEVPDRNGPDYLMIVAVVVVLSVLAAPAPWRSAPGRSSQIAVSEKDVLSFYYPKLLSSGVLDVVSVEDAESFDVLLLGASVLEQTSGRLQGQLQAHVEQPVRLFDLSVSLHTSRDSVFKLQALDHLRSTFDLIIVYHGINDVRMNCCRPGTFRQDYSHCGWYVGLQKRLKARSLMLSGTGGKWPDTWIPLGEPDARSLEYGKTVKTTGAFRLNIESILGSAVARKTPVVLMTFACHLPEDYSRDAFLQHELSYGEGSFRIPVESWGPPDGVAAAITAHNQAIRDLALQHEKVIFIDQDERLHESRFFSDVCHLTDAGIEVFVATLVQALVDKKVVTGFGKMTKRPNRDR